MITIATPMYGGVATAHYINSILQNILFLKEKNILVQWKFLTQESLIPRARNELVRQFLDETVDDYLMFIDADINFPADSIYKLICHKKEIVVGIYPKRQIYWDGIKNAVLNNVKDFWNFGCSYVFNSNADLDKNNPLIEIEHGATGFMCIHRSVFLSLKDRVPQYRTSDFSKYSCYNFFDTSILNGLYLSEDYHFSNLWTQFGGKIFADMSIKLDHIGNHVFSGDLLRAGKNTT